MNKNSKKFLVVLFIIIIIIVGYGLFKNNSSKKVDEPKKSIETKNKTKKVKDEYKLRDGEKFIKKTSTNMSLTKYNGAYYVNGVMIVNKSYPLDSTYQPNTPYKEITSDYIYGADYLDKTVMENYLKMKEEASKLGYTLKISSGYRSYKVQVDLYNNYVKNDGKEAADTYSARAGYSEHQSGLCFDVNGVNYKFLETPTGKWVNENAHKYGFILRFPEGKDDITGYKFEAWHYRYVGVELATKLYNNGNWISLEEYLGVSSKY